jgi:hypothetical protein
MVLPLNYAYSRGYGVDGPFLSKKIKLKEQTSPQIKSQHYTPRSIYKGIPIICFEKNQIFFIFSLKAILVDLQVIRGF